MAGKTNSTMAKLNTTTTAACGQGNMSEWDLAIPSCSPGEGPWPYLEGEGTQGRDGHQGCHEEGNHVAD